MYTNRCRICDVNWPMTLPLVKNQCPICEEVVVPFQADASPEWRERLAEHKFRMEHADDPFTEVKGTLRKEGKQYLLSSADVNNSGIHNRLQPDTVVRLVGEDGDALYVEVLGYSYQGRVYHVRLFQVAWPVDSKGKAYVPKKWVKNK